MWWWNIDAIQRREEVLPCRGEIISSPLPEWVITYRWLHRKGRDVVVYALEPTKIQAIARWNTRPDKLQEKIETFMQDVLFYEDTAEKYRCENLFKYGYYLGKSAELESVIKILQSIHRESETNV